MILSSKNEINEFVEQYYNDLIINSNSYSKQNNFNSKKKNDNPCLTEIDFYPPPDNRVLKSNVRDVNGGDNFADYCEYFFDLLEEEDYYD